MVRILFVMSGSLMEHGDTVRLVTSKQYVCLARGERFVTAQDDAHVVLLIHRIEFCEQDIFDKVMPRYGHPDQRCRGFRCILRSNAYSASFRS